MAISARMASDAPARPLLVIVSGAPASGKTTLAKRLAPALGLVRLCKDELREVIGDWVPPASMEETRKLGGAAYSLCFRLAEESLAVGVGVIVEAAFSRGSGERLLAPVVTKGQTVLIHLSAPQELSERRFRERYARGERHPVHRDVEVETVPEGELFAAGWARWERPLDLDVPVLEIDTSEGRIDDITPVVEFIRSATRGEHGVPANGGALGNGGSLGNGGVLASGAALGNGGNPGTVGAPGNGGLSGVGGAPVTGGAPGRGKLRARAATAGDAAALARIYNQGIEDRVATFETEPRSPETMAEQLAAKGEGHPTVVVERDGEVVGWASVSSYRSRPCYSGVGEFSVYVERSARGAGVGRAALEALFEACEARGFWKLVSRVFPETVASRALCRSVGFREVGVYHRHSRLDGEWRDCVIVEKLLGTATAG